jgi:ketosteroid isomerase-like protein
VTLRHKHVEGFNEGVRTGDWSRMLALLHDDAELEFAGIPVGPFRGKQAIRDAYEQQPPDDEIVLLAGDAYAWAGEPALRAGELRLEERDGKIARIRVQYER